MRTFVGFHIVDISIFRNLIGQRLIYSTIDVVISIVLNKNMRFRGVADICFTLDIRNYLL